MVLLVWLGLGLGLKNALKFSVCLVKKMITFILLNGMILYFIEDITINHRLAA